MLLAAVAAALALAPPSFTIRKAKPHELVHVARLQLDIFAPPPEQPALLPMLQGFFESQQ